jgi:hypothetical protein
MARTLNEFFASNPSDEQMIEWMQTEATDADLIQCCSTLVHRQKLAATAQGILDARRHQELKKPHWTATPNFWVAVLAMIFAAIAACPVVREWFQPSAPSHKAASSQPPQSNSVPLTLPTSTTSSPVSVP